MHGVVGGITALVGTIGAEVDPTKQPVRESFYVFLVLAGALLVLLWSFLRHLRRANTNLGSARLGPGEAEGAPPSVPSGPDPR
ncbi:MAG: hypothetical protein MUD13_02730 [Candidatus Nanopelagicales bacterium]|jgi:hypothetical protein|nr:hypothetical protein [Candidatus Nanopelagicales bacterium]